jgi:Kef-type K+ transport system membrane component KefB
MFIGGFLAGLIIPHDNGFAISMVEKFEDLTTILFLPLVCLVYILIGPA